MNTNRSKVYSKMMIAWFGSNFECEQMKEYVSFVSIKKEAGIRKYFLELCEVLRLL